MDVTAFELSKRTPAKRVDRYGDLPLGAVFRGDERYNRRALFNGPRRWDYWDRLENPDDHQYPNLWPDKHPAYFWAQLVMPAGSSMTLRGRFPHARYMKLASTSMEPSPRWCCAPCTRRPQWTPPKRRSPSS